MEKESILEIAFGITAILGVKPMGDEYLEDLNRERFVWNYGILLDVEHILIADHSDYYRYMDDSKKLALKALATKYKLEIISSSRETPIEF